MKKKYILRKKSEIDDLFSNGKYISNELYTIKFLKASETKYLFTVSSKKYKKAVDRNFIKNRMKMITYPLISLLENKKISIAIIYKNDEIKSFEEMSKMLNKLLFMLSK